MNRDFSFLGGESERIGPLAVLLRRAKDGRDFVAAGTERVKNGFAKVSLANERDFDLVTSGSSCSCARRSSTRGSLSKIGRIVPARSLT